MNVRCGRCQAHFTLGDVLYGGEGFKPLPERIQVECGRCALVFEAPVPGRAGRTSNPNVKKIDPAQIAARIESGEKLARVLKPRRPGEPSSASEPVLRAAPPPAVDEDGEFEASLRARQRNVRIATFVVGAGIVALLVALVAPVVKRKLFGGLGKEAQGKVERARQRLMLDDAQSLEQAVQGFTEAARLAPGEALPEAERACALLLLSESQRDLADRLEAAVRADNDRIARLQIDKPEGWEAQAAALADRVAKATAEREPYARDSQRLLGQGKAAATLAYEEDASDAAAQRALGLYFAVTDPDKAGGYLDNAARRAAQPDALTLYARAAASLSGTRSREKQDRALAALAEVQQAEPRFLRAVYDGAAISFERQQYGPAREMLDRVLKANPQHERARALLAQLPAAPE